jgi:pyruvate kinase
VTRRTKIVATLGPATDGDEALVALVNAGVDVVRLNLSHGPVAEHIDRLERVRAVAITVGKPIGVLADLPGPKVRAGAFVAPGVQLEAESVIRFEIGDGPSDADLIRVDYAGFLDDLAVGDRVVIGDGAIVARVQHGRPDLGARRGRERRTGTGLPRRPSALGAVAARDADRGGSRRSPRRWRRPESSSSPCRSSAPRPT